MESKKTLSLPSLLMGMALMGSILLTYHYLVIENETIDLTEMAGCSKGQDLSLRNATGTATYSVTFTDGRISDVKSVRP